MEYVDLAVIREAFSSKITLSRKYFLNTRPLESSRYFDEVFHVGSVYHLVFPFERVIALDVDLKFTVDIARLHRQFDRMSEENLIGIANDLAPHYWYDFLSYRLHHPGSTVGEARPSLQVKLKC